MSSIYGIISVEIFSKISQLKKDEGKKRDKDSLGHILTQHFQNMNRKKFLSVLPLSFTDFSNLWMHFWYKNLHHSNGCQKRYRLSSFPHIVYELSSLSRISGIRSTSILKIHVILESTFLKFIKIKNFNLDTYIWNKQKSIFTIFLVTDTLHSLLKCKMWHR